MPLQPIRVEVETARRFVRRALLLDAPVDSVAALLQDLGYVQIDPINVCGRMHDLIARNRVRNYREGDLMRYLHGGEAALPPRQRSAFEHHFPADGGASAGILAAFPLPAWPHLLRAMRVRSQRPGAWSGRLTRAQREAARRVFAAIAARGPLSSEDFDEPGRSRAVWGAATLVKATMQKLFFHGELLIAWRGAGNRRYYDLPGRVLPDLLRKAAEPSADETARWSVTTTLRQRRLVVLKRKELPLVEDLVQPLAVEGCPTLYCLREDLPRLEAVGSSGPGSSDDDVRLLAPLDPLIYDRLLTSRLWAFDYTWEAYTPPAKRVRGYYALPVLAGTRIVGHIDPKAEREAGRLRVRSRRIQHGQRSAAAVHQLAEFLGLRR
jgi:hypothetical protein